MKSKVISASLALFLLTTFAINAYAYQIVGLDNFQKEQTYIDDVFTDNNASNWYYPSVVSAYEYGLMDGIGNNLFSPNGNITIAQAIAIAVRINCIYFDGGIPEFETDVENTWYDAYVQSGFRRNIIESSYPNYNASARRAQFAEILSKSINPLDFEEINWIDDGAISDVPMNADYANAVYMLYRAGVLTGDDAGNFNPNSTITRAEAAAIITRIVDPDLRQSVIINGDY